MGLLGGFAVVSVAWHRQSALGQFQHLQCKFKRVEFFVHLKSRKARFAKKWEHALDHLFLDLAESEAILNLLHRHLVP